MTVSSLLDQLRKAAEEPRDYEDDTGILLRKAIEEIEHQQSWCRHADRCTAEIKAALKNAGIVLQFVGSDLVALPMRQLHEIEQLMTERDQYRDLAVSYAACVRVSAQNVDDLVRGRIAQKRKPKSK